MDGELGLAGAQRELCEPRRSSMSSHQVHSEYHGSATDWSRGEATELQRRGSCSVEQNGDMDDGGGPPPPGHVWIDCFFYRFSVPEDQAPLYLGINT
eukprot:CAMPEP_0183343750 /NCGR_PEP_ID=MMETSP0164_2-20130417/9578_1 /TAXON_ID=221442 /ORGANISM="Coccolithus pelagicus ssp braarudi, Strain PLY182g" /LENGTH=96 /DNA_ID=CAMNT_0025514627 /DNA_START=197 /DNA_END=487 /DNA_ORIENTATION=-